MVTTTIGVVAGVHTDPGRRALNLGAGEAVVGKPSRLGRGSEWTVRQIVLPTADCMEQAKIKL